MNGNSKKRKENVFGEKMKKKAKLNSGSSTSSAKTVFNSSHANGSTISDIARLNSGLNCAKSFTSNCDVQSNNKTSIKSEPAVISKIKCAKNDANLEKKCHKPIVSSATDKHQQSSSTKKSKAVSANWKELLKSGKVSYKKKPSSEMGNASTSVVKPNEIWFDDVDELLLDLPQLENSKDIDSEEPLVKTNSFDGVTKVIGMDCEMVGVGEGGKDSILARVSIVNHFGHCVYDTFVKPTEKVTDYRTAVSGVRPSDLVNAENFKTVQQKVADLLKDRVLVGHALHNDMKVLFLSHPRKDVRDTAQYKPFRELVHSGRPALKKLTSQLLGVEVQQGEHNSIQDAQAAMRLYTLHRKEWEKSLKLRRFHGKSASSKATNSYNRKTLKLKKSKAVT